MAGRRFVSDVIAGLLAKLGGNRHGNRHLSEREWAMLQAPRVENPLLDRERSQWTEDNLD